MTKEPVGGVAARRAVPAKPVRRWAHRWMHGDQLWVESSRGWTADSAKTKIDDGIDTFVFKDGFIRAHTVRYTLLKK